MNTPVAASVIIPTRGGRQRLHYPLDALREQTRTDFEVIVVVDGDVDSTENLLQDYRRRGFDNLRYHVFETNQGRSKALNQGIELAEGRIIIRCDDLEPRPDFIERHVASHRDKRISAVAGLTTNRFPDVPYAEAYGRDADRRFRSAALKEPASKQWRYWAANCSATREAYEAVGGYDERYRRYGWEDVDMGYRLAALGAEVRINEDLTAVHHGPPLTSQARATRALHSGAARDTFLSIHGRDALGPAPRPGGPWGLAVRALAAVMTEPVVKTVSGGVDRVLPWVPRAVGRKLVALCVEAAGLSGIRHPDRARTTF